MYIQIRLSSMFYLTNLKTVKHKHLFEFNIRISLGKHFNKRQFKNDINNTFQHYIINDTQRSLNGI